MKRILICVVLLAASAFAQNINLTVDATHAAMKYLSVREVIPVQPGPLTLYYPKWIPGMHGPGGAIGSVTGLHFTAAGKEIPWRRDLRDVFTFHLDVPKGVSSIEANFDFLESTPGAAANGSSTDKLVVINWNQALLYPAGKNAADIPFTASLVLPQGWKFASALRTANDSGAHIAFQSTSLERLFDSPLIAGQYFRVLDLTPPGEPIHHELDLVADAEADLAVPSDVQHGLTNVVAEAGKLFGARHYRDYHFLLTLSDFTAHFGLEHHESNDSRLPARVMLQPDAAREVGSLLAHEYAHSWSGKYRRPADLATPEYETPMETDLLWVYEGNTSFCGDLLAARSGMWTPADYQQTLASIAASLGPGRPGRTWRPLLDTAVAIPGMFRGGWSSWQRGSDYYEEGELIWLEVAGIIHQQSGGKKSMEDFFHSFYGGTNNGPEVKPYTFDQLVQALNATVPYDWAKFLNDRLNSTAAAAPTAGIESAGWKVEWSDQRPPSGRGGYHAPSGVLYSIGLAISPDGQVTDSLWDSPGFKAGIVPGMKVLGVNGRIYSPDVLSDAIAASKDSSKGIELLVEEDKAYRVTTVDYHGAQRYPHLVRDASKPDYLDEFIKPLAEHK